MLNKVLYCLIKIIFTLIFIFYNSIFANNNKKHEYIYKVLETGDGYLFFSPIPSNWNRKPEYENYDNDWFEIQYLPYGKKLNNSNEIIGIKVKKNIDLNTKVIKFTAGHYFSLLKHNFQNGCKDNILVYPLAELTENEVFVSLICGKRIDDKVSYEYGDITFYKIIKVKNNLYMMHYSWFPKTFNITNEKEVELILDDLKGNKSDIGVNLARALVCNIKNPASDKCSTLVREYIKQKNQK